MHHYCVTNYFDTGHLSVYVNTTVVIVLFVYNYLSNQQFSMRLPRIPNWAMSKLINIRCKKFSQIESMTAYIDNGAVGCEKLKHWWH